MKLPWFYHGIPCSGKGANYWPWSNHGLPWQFHCRTMVYHEHAMVKITSHDLSHFAMKPLHWAYDKIHVDWWHYLCIISVVPLTKAFWIYNTELPVNIHSICLINLIIFPIKWVFIKCLKCKIIVNIQYSKISIFSNDWGP